MTYKFNLQLCRTIVVSGTPAHRRRGLISRIVSYVQVTYPGDYAHEAILKAKTDYPGWAITDWKLEP